MPTSERTVRTCRAIWISDLHLGSRAARTELLLDFLRHHRCRQLYLVGDIFDLWSMRRGVYWDRHHNALLQLVFERAAEGTEVTYVPGNHDEALRAYAGHRFGGIAIAREAIHRTADGRRLLVLHGDEFDQAVCHAGLGAWIGSALYDVILWLSHWLHAARSRLGRPYWSLAAYLKGRVPQASAYIARFHDAAARQAAHRGVEGVVCGHIHRAALKAEDGFCYVNTGDWVENCSAVVEHMDGRLELVRWTAGAEAANASRFRLTGRRGPAVKEAPAG